MGSKSSKKKLKDIYGKSFICKYCNETFKSATLLNKHSIDCAHNSSIALTEPDKETLFNDKIFNKPSNKPFYEKVTKLKNYINSKKISWQVDYDNLSIDRENCLNESMEKYINKYINIWKEIHISFKGEDPYDAGGITREWFMVIIEELEGKKLNLFEKSDCDEYSYVPSKNLINDIKTLKYFKFIGILISKALIDNITINLCFNKIIYKLLINEKILFEDLKFIDTQLYLSIKESKKIDPELLKDLCMYYVYEYHDLNGNLISEELIPGGKDKLVVNLNDYVEKRIDFMTKKYIPFINEIKKGITDYIPIHYLKEFNSAELELLICGQPLIDIAEWEENSIYKGAYNKSHKVIKWFWMALSQHTQEELSKFLQFSTGSSRVPIKGFKFLESNRGEISKFCINSIEYNKKGNNYIKAHTCFNRIDLPIFKSEKEVIESIKFVLNNEIVGFGID